MLRWTGVIVGIVLIVSTSSVAMAQGQRGQRGQRTGQGPGGAFGSSVVGLLAMAEVQKELAITEDQKGLIADLMQDLRESDGGGVDRQEFRNLSQEERRKRIEEAQKRTDERAKKTEDLVKTILDPKQFERLTQLRLQREGPAALARTDVAESLTLTQEQKDKIAKIRETARSDRGPRGDRQRNDSQEDRQKAAAEFRERRDKTNTELLAVLTTDQKATWEKMQGKKFDFPQPQARRPGGN